MTDYEALDFFRNVKSTYAIFELPIGETMLQFFMFFTNYQEQTQVMIDLIDYSFCTEEPTILLLGLQTANMILNLKLPQSVYIDDD